MELTAPRHCGSGHLQCLQQTPKRGGGQAGRARDSAQLCLQNAVEEVRQNRTSAQTRPDRMDVHIWMCSHDPPGAVQNFSLFCQCVSSCSRQLRCSSLLFLSTRRNFNASFCRANASRGRRIDGQSRAREKEREGVCVHKEGVWKFINCFFRWTGENAPL